MYRKLSRLQLDRLLFFNLETHLSHLGQRFL